MERTTDATEINKWLLSIVALFVGSALTFGGTLIVGRINAEDDKTLEQTSFLREERVDAYATFVTELLNTQEALEHMAGTMLNASSDVDYFIAHEERVNAAIIELQTANGQIEVVGSNAVRGSATLALNWYQDLYMEIIDASRAHEDDLQRERFALGLSWMEYVNCATAAHRTSFVSYAQVDLGASEENPISADVTMSECTDTMQ